MVCFMTGSTIFNRDGAVNIFKLKDVKLLFGRNVAPGMTSKVYGVCKNKMKTTWTKTLVGDNTLDPDTNSVIKV